jgi:capsular polysaccharide transport system permease protein
MQHNSTFTNRLMPTLPASPLPKRSSWDIQRAVLFALVIREYRTRVGRHWTGIVWTIFEPLAHVLFFLLVFGYLRSIASSTMEYPVFLASGLMPFFLFRDLAQRLTESIDANLGLFSYRQVKPFDTIVARGIVECVTWLVVLTFTLGLLQWLGYRALPQQPLEFFGVAALTALLGGALGLFLAVVTRGRPRLRTLVRWLYLPLYITSGVMFSVDRIPPTFVEWLSWNPVLQLVDLSRNSFEPRHMLQPGLGWRYPASFVLVLLALALALYRRDRQQLMMER